MQWKDTTTYSRGDNVREPRIWKLELENKTVLVVHRHIWYENTWLMSASVAGCDVLDKIDLQTNDIKQAKARAVMGFRKYLADYKEVIDAAISMLSEVKG